MRQLSPRPFFVACVFASLLCDGEVTKSQQVDPIAGEPQEPESPANPRRPGKVAKQAGSDEPAGPRPDLEDVPYGAHERLKLDLWKARSDRPTPLLVFFHGGGGDKRMYRGNRLLGFCLQNGISAAAVNYRPNHQSPFPVPMQDAGRAIQFLRSRADEYNIDPGASPRRAPRSGRMCPSGWRITTTSPIPRATTPCCGNRADSAS